MKKDLVAIISQTKIESFINLIINVLLYVNTHVDSLSSITYELHRFLNTSEFHTALMSKI